MPENTGKELTIMPDKAIVAIGNQIDAIINECLPVAAQESQNFVQALTLANGIKALRNIFLTDNHIMETVKSMQNTHLGFMTDRTDLAIFKSQQGSGKGLKPYRYEDVAEVCIEAMLKGYRITNNEFNMIAGRFYAAKNGKFRMINDSEGVTDFQFTTTSPAYEPEQGGIQYAKVQGFASWKKDGQLTTLGSSTVAEDKLIFKIRVNKFMGEDAIVGKALSKLFSRVLMRIEGKIMPEATDVSDDDIIEAEIVNGSAADLTAKIKAEVVPREEWSKVPCPYCQEDIGPNILSRLTNDPEARHFGCPACGKEGRIENGKPIGSFPPDHTARNTEEFKDKVEIKPEKASTEERPDIIDESLEPPVDFWEKWRELWIGLRSPGYSTFFHKNRPRFEAAPSELKEEARAKWFKLYPNEPCPLSEAATTETEEDEKRNNLKTDAYDSLSSELNNMPQDVVMKAKKDIGFTKILGTLTLEELEALVKRCKELQKAVVDNQRVSMIDEIEGSYKEVEIQSALVKIERASLSGCSLTELGVIYDSLRENEGEDLA